MAISVDPPESEALLSPAQVAQICGLSRRAIYDAIRRGELKAFRPCARLSSRCGAKRSRAPDLMYPFRTSVPGAHLATKHGA